MIAWALDTLIGVSLLMLLVLALRRPVAHWFGAGWAYALWLLPLARIFMPPLEHVGPELAEAVPSYTMIVVPAAAVVAEAGETGAAWLLPFLIALWAGGAAIFAMWQQSTYSAFVMGIGPGRPGRPPEHGGVRVVECDIVDGPVAIGFVDRRIVVPADFVTRYSERERLLALDHELTHHRRGDIWWNVAALAVLAANWFNPIAWIAFRAFREDQELACDAAVAAAIPEGERYDYARALVKSASMPGQVVSCPFNQADQLKQRLRMMKSHRSGKLRFAGGMVALAGLGSFGLAVAAPGIAREAAPVVQPILAAAQPLPPVMATPPVALAAAPCMAPLAEPRVPFRTDGIAAACPPGAVAAVMPAEPPAAVAPAPRVVLGADRAVSPVAPPVVPAAPAETVAPQMVEIVVDVAPAIAHARVAIASARSLAQVRTAGSHVDPQLIATEVERALAEAESDIAVSATRRARALAVIQSAAVQARIAHAKAQAERRLHLQMVHHERRIRQQVALSAPPSPPAPPAPPPPVPVT